MPSTGEKPTSFPPPFPVPRFEYDSSRRSSTSSASSSSDRDSERTRVPYKDERSLDDLDPNSRQQNKKCTKSRLRQEENLDDGDDDDDEERDLMDEEERVGLMMQSKYAGSSEKTTGIRHFVASRLGPSVLLVIVTILAILVLVPTLGWLATANRVSSLRSTESHLVDTVIPPHWALPNQPSLSSNFRKIKHPLPSGQSKLKAFGAPFEMDFVTTAPLKSSNRSALLPITMHNIFDDTFAVRRRSLQWCPQDPDEGVFIQQNEQGDIVVEDVTHLRKDMTGKGEVAKGGGKVTLALAIDMTDSKGNPLHIHQYKLSSDMRHLLLFTDQVRQWRYSSFSKVWLYDVVEKTTTQIGLNKTSAAISTAAWSTKDTHISFVEGNNLYVIKDVKQPSVATAVTTTGNANVFNGIPDWVYEEEVLAGDIAHWWSPDGNRLAYFELDESAVKTYSFPIYNPTDINGKASLYPQSVNMKYPKPGTPNPSISVWVYDVTSGDKSELTSPPVSQAKGEDIDAYTTDIALRTAGNDVLVTQINWVNDYTVMLRETNRWSDAMRYMVHDCRNITSTPGSATGKIQGTVSRRLSTTKSGGWVQIDRDVHVINSNTSSTAYVDVIDLKHDYRHIAYFPDAANAKPVFLTKGAWEVDQILFVGNNRVYFTAAYPKPAYRHVLYVDIPADASTAKATDVPRALTDTSKPGFFTASFDPKGNYYILDDQGPSIPSSRVLSLRDSSFELILEDNSKLRDTLSKYVQPVFAYYNITTKDGSVISVVEQRPYDFDESGNTRYPVLINVYGGPNSQKVQTNFKMGEWHTYLTCSLGYIVVLMDGRGTGFKGRDYRDTVTWRLGEIESRDVVEGAQAIRRLPYVAQSKVGVWGWSYGGYLSAKVVERNSGAFDLAMSVAPVTRWEFYDSIYTERYMKTPRINKVGYENSSIHITDGFKNTQFLLAQGSADDNVHFQNSAHMLDMLQGAKIRNFWFEMFPDSNHNIDKRGANAEVYDFLTKFLVNNWGAGGKRTLRYDNDKGLSTVL